MELIRDRKEFICDEHACRQIPDNKEEQAQKKICPLEIAIRCKNYSDYIDMIVLKDKREREKSIFNKPIY